jgi:hypothetical protein
MFLSLKLKTVLFFCSVLLGLFWFSHSAMANQDFVISREYLRDQEARLSIQDIVQAQFEPAQRRISKGFSPAAHWIRITVAPAGAGTQAGGSGISPSPGQHFLMTFAYMSQTRKPRAAGPTVRRAIDFLLFR